MRTRVACFAERLIESGCLAAVIIVPILFNSYSERGFEEDKLPFLRSIATILAVAGVAWVAERGRDVFHEKGKSIWRAPLILPWGLMIGSYALSTFFSIAPAVSFWGDYVRRQGTYTHFSYMLLFILVVLSFRSAKQVSRLVTIMAITSFPVVCYGLIQRFGLDPVVWTGAVFLTRVPSTAGNPIFMAAYLSMVVPLTLSLALQHIGAAAASRHDSRSSRRHAASCISAFAYLLLLVLQLMTILSSESRGPVVGLLVGLSVFAILFALQHGARLRKIIFSLLLAALIGTLGILALARIPHSPLRGVPTLDRLSTILETGSGSGRVRILIWQGVCELLAKATPGRLLLGYGPETLSYVYSPYYPPEMGHVEDRGKLPDRSHNETFDYLVTLGFLGLAAKLLLFGSVFHYILAWLGFIDTRRQSCLFFSLCVMGILSGILLPYLVQHSLALAAIGIPAGLIVGMVLYLLLRAITLPATKSAEHPHGLLLTGFFSAILAHFTEIQLGIANSMTLSYFWIYAALSLVVGMPLLRAEEAPEPPAIPAPEARRKKRHKDKKNEIRHIVPAGYFSDPTLHCLSLMMGLMLPVLIFDFVIPEFRMNIKTLPLLLLYAFTWMFGGILITTEAAGEQTWSDTRWIRIWSIYTSISLSACAIYLIFHVSWIRMRAPLGVMKSVQLLLEFEAHRANTVTILYVWAFLIMIGCTLWLTRSKTTFPQLTRSHSLLFVYPIALILAIGFIVAKNLDISLADIYQKRAQEYIELKNWDGAIVLFRRALEVQPRQDAYLARLADAYLLKAQADPGNHREALLRDAIMQLTQAQQINPHNHKHALRIATVHHAWAKLTADPEERAQQLHLADQLYSEAITYFPTSVVVWNDWAKIAADQQDWQTAVERINRSLEVDPTYPYAYELLGDSYLQQRNWTAARDACLEGIRLELGNIEHWSSLGVALTQLGENEQAIQANLKVLEIRPDDPITYGNLALLYSRTGDIEKALASAKRALAAAPPQERPAIERWMKEIEKRQ